MQKTNSPFWPIYILGTLLIILGVYYRPSTFAQFIVGGGELLPQYTLIILFLDGLLIVGGFLLILFRKKAYEKRKEIILLLGTFVLLLTLLELSTRAYIHAGGPERESLYLSSGQIKRASLYSPHHYLNYYTTPHYVSPDGKNKHNSLGFRGEEVLISKPEETFRIVALGGSTTYTIAVKDHTKSYPALLGEVLKEKYGHQNIEVINAGVGSYNSWESLINLQFRVLDLDPDLIIIYHSTNDVHARLVHPDTYRGDNIGKRKQWEVLKEPLLLKSAVVRFAFTKITGRSIAPALGPLITAQSALQDFADEEYREELNGTAMETLEKNPPIYFERNIQNMISIAKKNGVKVLLTTWAHSPLFDDYASTDHYQKAFKEHNQLLTKVGQDKEVYFYDFAAHMPTNKEYWADGRHVNEKGSLLKALLFAQFIEENKVLSERS